MLLVVVVAVGTLTDLRPGARAHDAEADARRSPAAQPPRCRRAAHSSTRAQAGPLAVGVRLRRTAATVTLTGRDGNGVTGAPVTIDGRPAAGLRAAAATARRGRAARVAVGVGGRTLRSTCRASAPRGARPR